MATGENILGRGISSGQSHVARAMLQSLRPRKGLDFNPRGRRVPSRSTLRTDTRGVGAKGERKPGLRKSRDAPEEVRTVLKEPGGSASEREPVEGSPGNWAQEGNRAHPQEEPGAAVRAQLSPEPLPGQDAPAQDWVSQRPPSRPSSRTNGAPRKTGDASLRQVPCRPPPGCTPYPRPSRRFWLHCARLTTPGSHTAQLHRAGTATNHPGEQNGELPAPVPLPSRVTPAPARHPTQTPREVREAGGGCFCVEDRLCW